MTVQPFEASHAFDPTRSDKSRRFGKIEPAPTGPARGRVKVRCEPCEETRDHTDSGHLTRRDSKWDYPDFSIDGRAATLDDLMPDFGDADRLAVVVRSPLGGVGASALILAMVIDFYAAHVDDLRALSPGQILYPEHYVIHVGAPRGDYAWLDVWPPNKEVVVPADRVSIVRSLLDHGITRLLVEDLEVGPAARDRSGDEHTLERQLVTSLAFSPTGRTFGADVRIASNHAVEQWVGWTIDPHRAALESERPSARSSDRLGRATEVDDLERDQIRSSRTTILENSVPVETYRRITTAEAISLLVP